MVGYMQVSHLEAHRQHFLQSRKGSWGAIVNKVHCFSLSCCQAKKKSFFLLLGSVAITGLVSSLLLVSQL